MSSDWFPSKAPWLLILNWLSHWSVGCVSHWSVGCVSSEQVLTGKVFEAYHVTGPFWGTSSMSLVHMGWIREGRHETTATVITSHHDYKWCHPFLISFFFADFKRVVWPADPTFGAGQLQTACSGALCHQHGGEMLTRQKGRRVPCGILQCSVITSFTSTCSKQLFGLMVIKVHSLHLCLQSWRKFSIPDQEWNKGIECHHQRICPVSEDFGILFFLLIFLCRFRMMSIPSTQN